MSSAFDGPAHGYLLSSLSGSSLSTRLFNVTSPTAVTSSYLPVTTKSRFALQTLQRQGNLSASLQLQGSNEAVDTSWVTYQSADFAQGQASHIFEVAPFGAALVRVRIVPVSGSGSIDVLQHSKK